MRLAARRADEYILPCACRILSAFVHTFSFELLINSGTGLKNKSVATSQMTGRCVQ
jgi:hypothetical protein